MSLIIIRWSFEQCNPEQPPPHPTPPPGQRAILHRQEGYLIILVLLQTTDMASFYARQGLLFLSASSLVGTGALPGAIATGCTEL